MEFKRLHVPRQLFTLIDTVMIKAVGFFYVTIVFIQRLASMGFPVFHLPESRVSDVERANQNPLTREDARSFSAMIL